MHMTAHLTEAVSRIIAKRERNGWEPTLYGSPALAKRFPKIAGLKVTADKALTGAVLEIRLAKDVIDPETGKIKEIMIVGGASPERWIAGKVMGTYTGVDLR